MTYTDKTNKSESYYKPLGKPGAPRSVAEGQEKVPFNKKIMQTEVTAGIIYFVGSLGLVIGIYWLLRWFLGIMDAEDYHQRFWWCWLWVASLTFLVLGLIESSFKNAGDFKKPITSAFLLVFVFCIAFHYISEPAPKLPKLSDIVNSDPVTPKVPSVSKIYGPGTYYLEIPAGGASETWIAFPNELIVYECSSSDYGYKMLYSDGTVIFDQPGISYPEKQQARFYIVSLGTKQTVKLTVRKG